MRSHEPTPSAQPGANAKHIALSHTEKWDGMTVSPNPEEQTASELNIAGQRFFDRHKKTRTRRVFCVQRVKPAFPAPERSRTDRPPGRNRPLGRSALLRPC